MKRCKISAGSKREDTVKQCRQTTALLLATRSGCIYASTNPENSQLYCHSLVCLSDWTPLSGGSVLMQPRVCWGMASTCPARLHAGHCKCVPSCTWPCRPSVCLLNVHVCSILTVPVVWGAAIEDFRRIALRAVKPENIFWYEALCEKFHLLYNFAILFKIYKQIIQSYFKQKN